MPIFFFFFLTHGIAHDNKLVKTTEAQATGQEHQMQ